MCVLSGIGVSNLIRDIMKNFFEKKKKTSNNKKDGETLEMWTISQMLTYAFALFLIFIVGMMVFKFMLHGTIVGADIYSNPSVILSNRDYSTGSKLIIDDFRESFYWLRQNTDESAKIFSWWDYGYQLAGFSNRTTLTDNNTWNHTHIAQIGRIFASSEEAAYELLDQLDVDYVLLVFGGKTGYSGDDINKFLWMLRIAANAYPHLKESDFTVNGYAIDQRVSPALKESIMYKLSYYRFWDDYSQRGKGFDHVRNQVVGHTHYKLQYFEEVFTSSRWIVRIFKRKQKNNREDIAYLSKSFSTSETEVKDPEDEFIYEK